VKWHFGPEWLLREMHEMKAVNGHSARTRPVRVVLGTAQLGMPYGIANVSGRPGRNDAVRVIEAAWQHRVHTFDTAQAYGDSERVLGEAIEELGLGDEARVVTKLHPELSPQAGAAIVESIANSVSRLRVKQLWGLLLHRPGWLEFWNAGLGAAIGEAHRRGLFEHFGVSVYTVEEAQAALEHAAVALVQLPANAWDQRALSAGIFRLAAQRGKMCQVRSIYLQGLLVLSPEEVAARLPLAKPAADRWHSLAAELDLTPAELAMRFALCLPAPLVIGMETVDQVKRNAAMLNLKPLSSAEVSQIHAAMAPWLSEQILNPARWQEFA